MIHLLGLRHQLLHVVLGDDVEQRQDLGPADVLERGPRYLQLHQFPVDCSGAHSFVVLDAEGRLDVLAEVLIAVGLVEQRASPLDTAT